DSVGEEDSNQVLSEDRARACFQYLLVNGVEVNRMSYKGYGETMPIANNSTQEGRRFNRRVEFELQVQ
ncbi:MAG: OmpA family protein, partial [Saprospiraceae bacterium]|nr:OmpA family protein [Saprospiraceae bacterium]